MFDSLQQELEDLKAQHLVRSWRRIDAVEGARIRVDDRWVIHLASNGYLGLHLHPRVISAAQEAIGRYGTGAGSARLIGGTCALHEELEAALAAFKKAQAALLFPTGYMANLGIVTTLVGPGDLIVCDHLNHASLIDACRLSRATFRVYPHCDVERLESALTFRGARCRRTLVVTEGLFSMDGDIAPLPQILKITRRYGAWLLVDDAHATGVLGPSGRGSLDHFGLPTEGVLQMGTLSKALGSMGGFLAGSKEVVEILKNKARSFLYTTALPPGSVAAAGEALKLIQEEPGLRSRLRDRVRRWTEGLKGRPGLSPIVPIRIGPNEKALEFSRDLWEAGVFAPAIRPPTVPAGSARIRTSVTASHTEEDLEAALRSFEEVFKKFFLRIQK